MAQNIMATKPPPPIVIGVRLKKTSAEVIRAGAEPIGGGSKEEMTVVTRKTVKNAVEVLTNSEQELNSMMVCTYPETYPDDGRIVKAHHKVMLEAIRRKFGDFSYFTAIEYQSRGAPHFHVGLSFDLALLGQGEIISLKRKKSGRRYPAFQTVKPIQDWAFETWLEIIAKPDISYNGEPLEWSGIDEEDEAAMRKAYNQYNAGFSWEVMREKNGATRYFVKELTGLKLYQKTIPQGYKHPGRHFLYSTDMRFDDENAITFIVDDGRLRELLQVAGWKYLPEEGKPLYKYLWNSAADLAVALIQAGYRPVKAGLDALKRFADRRLLYFVSGDLIDWAAWNADVDLYHKAKAHWENEVKSIIKRLEWEFIMSEQLNRAGPDQLELAF